MEETAPAPVRFDASHAPALAPTAGTTPGAPNRRYYNHWALRALLTLAIHQAGRVVTVAELVDVVTREGIDVGGRPSKVVSDSLRAEVSKGWVVRVGRGRYAPGRLPKSSKSRLRARLRRARET